MEEFKANSDVSRNRPIVTESLDSSIPKSKTRRERDSKRQSVTKVTKGAAIVKKKSGFLSEDLHSVAGYAMKEVLLPSLKDLLVDIVQDGISLLVLGETRKRDRFRGGRSRNDYSKISRSDRDYRDRDYRDRDYRDRPSEPDNIELESEDDALEVLDSMDEILDKQGFVTIIDLYELVGIEKYARHTDNNYGWRNLDSATIKRTNKGWRLILPRVKAL